MTPAIPSSILDMLSLADPSWRPHLLAGLEATARADPAYLPALVSQPYLPNGGRLFAAFAQPLDAVRYVLVGEGPYPRAESATGVCFMDGAVGLLWSEKGFSVAVNRATSLRNFIKMLLVADGQLAIAQTNGEAIAHISLKARAIGSTFIQTLADLQANLTRHGFLLMNAALVFRPHVAPIKDAKAWYPFLQAVLTALFDHAARMGTAPPTLVLWGKAAGQLDVLPSAAHFPKAISEHPYNLSFIANSAMQNLFASLHLLQKQETVYPINRG